LHQAVLEEWSRRSSPLHRRDARAKILALLAYLAALSGAAPTPVAAAGFTGLAMAGVALGRLPVWGILWRAAVVLPFSAAFAGLSLASGDSARAASLLLRSYLSAAAVLILAGATPLPALLKGLEGLGAPRFLILVVQFLYRYLFVLSEQAQHMRLAAAARGGTSARRRPRRTAFRAAAGAVGVLLARSQARAQGIHQAMLARGFRGSIPALSDGRMGTGDWAFLAGAAAVCLAVRLAAELAS
jgi:cobalt/nickel transport system permease protein